MSLLRCDNVTKKFDRFGQTSQALKNVSFDIQPKEFVAFVGKSGSGKSTLIRCLLRLEKPSSGEIYFGQRSFSSFSNQDLAHFRTRVAWISQDHHLLQSKTVFENVAFPLRLEKKPEHEIQSRVQECLEYLEIADKAHFYPSQLSGGQLQRVNIGRAIVKRPEVLLCDEPTSALDSTTSESILNLLKKLKSEFVLTILMVTHNRLLANQYCDRIFECSEGSVVEKRLSLLKVLP